MSQLGQRNVCVQLLKGKPAGVINMGHPLINWAHFSLYLSAFLGPEMLMPGLKQRFDKHGKPIKSVFFVVDD